MNFSVLLTYITPHRRVLMTVLGLLLAGSLLRFFTSYRIGTTGEQLTAGLRERLYQHLQALSQR